MSDLIFEQVTDDSIAGDLVETIARLERNRYAWRFSAFKFIRISANKAAGFAASPESLAFESFDSDFLNNESHTLESGPEEVVDYSFQLNSDQKIDAKFVSDGQSEVFCELSVLEPAESGEAPGVFGWIRVVINGAEPGYRDYVIRPLGLEFESETSERPHVIYAGRRRDLNVTTYSSQVDNYPDEEPDCGYRPGYRELFLRWLNCPRFFEWLFSAEYDADEGISVAFAFSKSLRPHMEDFADQFAGLSIDVLNRTLVTAGEPEMFNLGTVVFLDFEESIDLVDSVDDLENEDDVKQLLNNEDIVVVMVDSGRGFSGYARGRLCVCNLFFTDKGIIPHEVGHVFNCVHHDASPKADAGYLNASEWMTIMGNKKAIDRKAFWSKPTVEFNGVEFDTDGRNALGKLKATAGEVQSGSLLYKMSLVQRFRFRLARMFYNLLSLIRP